MAAEVEVQSGEMGRSVAGGRLHLSPLIDSNNKNLLEISPLNQSHIISPEPNKPSPSPKPRLTPKPFTVDRNATIKPILAPKPQPKPRPESTRLPGYKPDPPTTPKPQQPLTINKPRPTSTNPSRPSPTSFKSPKLNAGQTNKPVAQPFKPAPPLVGDPSKPISPVPAERQKPSNLTHSRSLKRPPSAEWSGSTKKEERDLGSPSKVGTSITRAKSMGYLLQIGQEEEEKPKSEAAVPLRPQPRGVRPRPVSAIFPTTPTSTESPNPNAFSRPDIRPLSADLTSRFGSIGLHLHRKTQNAKENTPEDKVPPQKSEQEKSPKTKSPESNDGATKPAASDQSNQTRDNVSAKDTEDIRGVSIKSRISLLLDSSCSPVMPVPGQAPDIHSPMQTGPEAEPAVGVKQLIKQLTVDTTPNQSPVLKPALKPRPLPLDLTKRFSPDPGVSLNEATDCHDTSKAPLKRNEDSANTSTDLTSFVDSQDQLKTPVSGGPEFLFSPNENKVQTVRASLFENVVEKHSVLMVDENKSENKAPSSPLLLDKTDEEGKVVTATYKEPVSPSGPVRVVHSFDTVPATEESTAISENVLSAQREDKAMTLRSRRSEMTKKATEKTGPESAPTPPRYLRVGALPKWTLDQNQETDLEKGMPKDAQREDKLIEFELLEDISATAKSEEQAKPSVTYFVLTGQMQETMTATLDTGDMPFGDQKTSPFINNLPLDEAFGKSSEDNAVNEREKQKQLESERQAQLEFARMKEREMQREFERERQKAFEKEKREFEEKQRALGIQKQIELERLKHLEFEKQRQLELKRQRLYEKQKHAERQQQLELENRRQVDLLKQKQDLERQKQLEMERQKQLELENQRQIEMERQIEIQKQNQLEAEKQRRLELERQKQIEMEREKQIELEQLKQIELEKQRQKQAEIEKQRQIEIETQRQIEADRQKQRELERVKQIDRQKQIELERQRQLESERQKKAEIERLQQIEIEKQRQIEAERQKQKELERQKLIELEKQRQRELERQRLEEIERAKQMELERERQRQLDKERYELEKQRQRDEERRQKELDKERKLLEKQEQERRQRQQVLELEKQRLREKMEREQAEKLRQMALEQEMLRLRELDKEREKQREQELQRQRELERDRQKQLDLEAQELQKQRLRQQEQEKERLKKEELERIQEMEKRQLMEFEKQKQAERQQVLELEKRRLREKMEREEADKMRQIAKQQEAERHRLKEKQKKEEQERIRLESESLRPKVVDIDAVLRNAQAKPSSRSDVSTRWKEPSPKAEQTLRPSILDNLNLQSQSYPSRDLFPVSGIVEVGPRTQVPPQNSGGLQSPVWTLSSQDPWEIRSVEMSVDRPEQTRKQPSKAGPEQLLLRQEERDQAPQRRWSALVDDPFQMAPFSVPVTKAAGSAAGVSSSFLVDQGWLPRDPRAQPRSEGPSQRRSQGSQELTRLRSRSMSRRSAPSNSAVEGSLYRMRSRSAHRDQGQDSWVQQKQSVSPEDELKDSETPVHDTDSQYGTWETGLRSEDSLTPATPSSESNLSPSPRKPTSPQTPTDDTPRLDTADGVLPSSSSESQPLSFPDAPVSLLDNSAQRSRAQLGKKRAPRTRPSRAARQAAAQDEITTEDQLYKDSTEEKTVESKTEDSDSEEKATGADAGHAATSQPQRVALFPGMDQSALMAQLKKRGESDNQTDGPTPSPSQLSRSPKSPFLPRAARVLPPPGGKENGEEDSPQWLKELKSKKRLSQYETES